MTWNLFIDDERFPPDDGREWVIARNWVDVRKEILSFECYPSYISFDHDLGESEVTGYDIIKMMIEDSMNFPDDLLFKFPSNFSFYVHSQNPIGKENIEGLLNNYLKYRN